MNLKLFEKPLNRVSFIFFEVDIYRSLLRVNWPLRFWTVNISISTEFLPCSQSLQSRRET